MPTPAARLLDELFDGALAVEGWLCASVERDGRGGVEVRFERVAGRGALRVSIAPKGREARAFQRLARCDLRYQAEAMGADVQADARAAAASLLALVAGAFERALADDADTDDDAPPDRALGASSRPSPLALAPAALGPFFEAELTATIGGFALADVYGSERLWSDGGGRVVLDFARARDEARALIAIGRDDAGAPSVSEAMRTEATLAERRSLIGRVRTALSQRAPKLSPAEAPPEASSATAPTRSVRGVADRIEAPVRETSLKIVVASDCGQSCEFCSIRRTWVPESLGQEELARLRREIDEAAAAGVRTLRVSGVDPLRFARIVDVLAHARARGFEAVEIHSPTTSLADEARCEAVVAALPAQRAFHVPMYATDPATHDAIVGRAGAHDELMRALANLSSRVSATSITLVHVCTQRALPEAAKVAALARARGWTFRTQLPFPDVESRADRFFRVTPTQRAAAEALVEAGEALVPLHTLLDVGGLAPCVALGALDAKAPARGRTLRERLARGELRTTTPQGRRTAAVPCPHADACALVPPCTGDVLRAYVRLHGDGELVPLRTLDAAGTGATDEIDKAPRER